MSLNFTVQPGKVWVSGEKITTAKLNQTALPVITAEGVTSPTDMAAADYSAVFGPGDYFYAAATLSSANYTAEFDPVITTYVDGLWLAVKVNATNPANATLDVGVGAKPLYQHGARSRAEAGDIVAGSIIEVRYNTTLVLNGCWEVMTPIGPRPARAPFQPASAYVGGEQGLVPAPAASSTRKYLRDDGTWVDAVALAVAQATPNSTYNEIFKQQQFV